MHGHPAYAVLLALTVVVAVVSLVRSSGEPRERGGFRRFLRVALPVLWPSLLGTFALLFANAFGAVATAMALTGSSLSLVPILLFAQIRGDVLQNPHLGYAIAFAMIAITGIANMVYIVLRSRAERWQK